MTPIRGALLLVVALMGAACTSATSGPDLPAGTSAIPVRDSLRGYPTYTVILDDMRAEGVVSPEYFHQYRIVYEDTSGALFADSAAADSLPTGGRLRERTTPWMPVSEETYLIHENNLGMTILSKDSEGGLDTIPAPPGYAYVGDSRYGEWRTDQSGNSFWAFYGQYALLRALMGGTVYGSDWNAYRGYRGRGVPYYGRDNQYGTYGTRTRTTRPDFYARQARTADVRRARFEERVNSRTRRSNMSGFRGRSGGFGK